MNILYLSHLCGESYAGPTYSVPKQIEAQSKIDNVFWYNATKSGCQKWKSLSYYHDLNEYPEESIYALPEPFNHPDLVVVELFYNMTLSNLRKELVSGKIPYIIIPRGELTKQAQKRKKIKKKIANILFCRKYARKAIAIQYLTEQEYRDSGDCWNNNHFVIPNGINIPEREKTSFSNAGIKCVSIGRIEPYQKGLDLLIETCFKIKDILRDNKFSLSIFGTDCENKSSKLKKLISNYDIDDIISIHGPVFGTEKEKKLLESDIFVMPSRFEGHPIALIEAFSYGLPAIATSGSNMRKKIDQYNAGWTADCCIESLANAITKMVSERNLISIKAKNAYKLALAYDWDAIAQTTHNLYKDLF